MLESNKKRRKVLFDETDILWDQETVRSSRTTRTKIPLKSLISEGFFLFFVYCGAKGEAETKYTTLAQTTVRIYSLLTISEIRFK